MGGDFIGQLLNLIGSPIVLVGLIAMPFVLYQAKRSPRLAWFLVTLCCFAASLSVFRDEFTPIAPALVFPLEQIRAAGRPLAIVFLLLLLWLGINRSNSRGWRQTLMPTAIWALVTIQGLIFVKVLVFGSVAFALLAMLTFLGVVLMIRLGPARWLQDNYQFHLAMWAIAMVGVVFMVINGYQALFDTYPITFVHGAFLGTTGNPQHAATLLASTIPGILFLTQTQTKRHWNLLWFIVLIFTFIALFLTGSRTGAVMGLSSTVLFFRQVDRRMTITLFLGIFLLALLSPFMGVLQNVANTSPITGQLLNLDNTRSQVWAGMWQSFNTYPIFGAPLRGDRLGYGENSWLAIAATLGSIGLIPLGIFGANCIQMILKLGQITTRSPAYLLHGNAVIAGLSALLVGSIFEAFLLGTITFPLIVLLLYLALGQYLIELHKISLQSYSNQDKNSFLISSQKQQIRTP